MDRILALDISTKTGWAFGLSSEAGFALVEYGTDAKLSEPESEPYPGNYVYWATLCFDKILAKIIKYQPTVLVIEETAGGSKNAHSQKILEFIHFLVAQYIRNSAIECEYYQTEYWRRVVGCTMTKEEKDRNKLISKTRAANPDQKVVKIAGKRIGKTRKKHVNVRRANEILGSQLKVPLIMKDEDQADALLMAFTFHTLKRPDEQHLE